MNFNVTKTGNNIIANVNGTNFSIIFTPENYSALLKMQDNFDNCQTRKEATELINEAAKEIEKMTKQLWGHEEAFEVVVENMIVKSAHSGEMFLVVGDKKVDVPFPESLRNRIQEAIDSESDFMPVVKAWTRFLRNPNLTKRKAELFGKYLTNTYTDYNKVKEYTEAGLSEDLAIEKATFPDVSLTKEGFLCCYKYVELEMNKFDKETGEKVMRYKHSFNEETGELELDKDLHVEDFYFIPPVMRYEGDAFTTGGVLGHRVQIGEVHELPSWDMVDCDDSRSCVPGLRCSPLAA